MPIYAYEPRDESAGSEQRECCRFETLQSMSEKPLSECPTCGQPIKRAISSFSMASRGGGGTATHSGAPASTPIVSSSQSATPSGRASRLAMRHICGVGCKH